MKAALPLLKERAKTLNDLIAGADFIVAERPLDLDEAAAVLLDADARALLAALLPVLEALDGLVGRRHRSRGQGLRRRRAT